jgi:hypothetical protein
MFCVPSVNGRMVHSFHPEIFVTDGEEKAQARDVERFFAPGGDDAERIDVVRRHHVRWIILNRKFLDKPAFDRLLVDSAVVRRDDGMVLMDADRWVRARRAARSGVRRSAAQASGG